MKDIETKIESLKLDEVYPTAFRKLLNFNEEIYSIYAAVDCWFHSLGFNMELIPVRNEDTDEIRGFTAALKLSKSDLSLHTDNEYLRILKVPENNRANCYAEMVEFAFDQLEEHFLMKNN